MRLLLAHIHNGVPVTGIVLHPSGRHQNFGDREGVAEFQLTERPRYICVYVTNPCDFVRGELRES